MSAVIQPATTAWPTSDAWVARARRRSLITGGLVLAFTATYAAAIVATGDDSFLLLVPLIAALLIIAILARPASGIYVLFGAALLFEQWQIAGLTPITAMTHIYENISSYTELPLRLSVSDLLVLLTLASWAVRRLDRSREPLRMGQFGRPVAGFAGVFALGLVIGAARGGSWDPIAALAELRGPLYVCLLYFLTVNVIRDRRQFAILIWEFVALVGVKAVQAILNNDTAASLPYSLEAVTSHEDVVFFDVAIALLLVLLILGVRTRLTYALLALQPLILGAELLTERRAGFVALAAVLLVIALLAFVSFPRRGLILVVVGTVVFGAYLAVFWEQSGPIAEPIRAMRSVLDPNTVSNRDAQSDNWRVIENRNISYTVGQLPLTGVGLGQPYLFHFKTTPLIGFAYWNYMTHNQLLWLWLKAGPLGALALWFLVARVLVLGSTLYVQLRDPTSRWVAVLPVLFITVLLVFSAVDLGLTVSRTTIVMGTILALGASPAHWRSTDLAKADGTGSER
jgi:O-antigen ligase/polysaccharide polymerase Wzy-like membrane protein